jgi:hypothetical protein
MTTGDFILGILTSLISSILIQLRHYGYTLLKQLAVASCGKLTSYPILPISLFAATLFVLTFPPVKVLAPSPYEVVVDSKGSPLVWTSTSTGKSYIVVTDARIDFPLIKAVDNSQPKY